MKTIILQRPEEFEFTKTDPPEKLKANEALLKVHRIGICGTDLHAYAGDQPFFDYPRILGHELGVEVIDTGSEVDNVSIGDKCSVEPYRYTHPDDPAVRRGKPNCAEHLSVLGVHEDGGMRERFTFPAKYLHSSQELSYDQLALIEPLGIGCHAVNRAQLNSDDKALVIGIGPIGLGAIQFAQMAASDVAVMDIDQNRLEFAKKEIGIQHTIQPTKDTKNTEAKIRQTFNGELPTVVFDATGSKKSMEAAINYVAHGGKLVYIGLFQGNFTLHDPTFHKKELTLLSSRNALSTDFDQIIRAIEQNNIDTTPWITHRAHFDDMISEFDHWTRPESNVIKAMVDIND